MKKRILKWVIGILLTPIILFFISATLLYLPPIQDFAVRKATAYLSETTGMKVHIGRLRLTFLFDIDLQDVQIKDGQDDSLLDVERLSVDLSFASLLHGEIDVEGIELTRAAVNTKSMIAGVEIKGSIGRFFVNSHGIEIPQEMVTVNTALLSDADVAIALTDSTTEDTTASSPVNWKIALGQVDLARTRVRFSMPGDSMTVSGGILTAALRNGLIDLGCRFAILRPAIRENRRRTGCQPYRTSGHRPGHRQYHIRRKRLGAFTGFARNVHERKKRSGNPFTDRALQYGFHFSACTRTGTSHPGFLHQDTS